jgi:uridylate kinase
VDGVYDKDPSAFPDAKRFENLDYDYCIDHQLGVMDLSAFTLCRQNDLPIIVFSMLAPGNVRRVVSGEPVGTVVGRKP